MSTASTVKEGMKMKQYGITLFFLACIVWVVVWSPFLVTQESVSVNWHAQLEKAKAGIEKNLNSAFWHNQAGVAYDALGKFDSATEELKIASSLDPNNTISDYALYALYKKKGMIAKEREILLKVLEKDSENPFGRFEFATVLEKESHLEDALREYRVAKRLVASIKGSEYIDSRGNPYEINGVREKVDQAIERVKKRPIASEHSEK